MAHFYQKEYLTEDLQRWFEGSTIFSNTREKAGMVEELDINDGIVSFRMRDIREEDEESWWEEDVETSFETYGCVQLGRYALFFSRLPNRQYSFGLKQRQFNIEHLPGMAWRSQVNMLDVVEQFHNRTTYSMEEALALMAGTTKRSCVLSEDVRVHKVYERESTEAKYMLSWRGNVAGFVEEGNICMDKLYVPFQDLIMQDVA